MRVDLIDKSSGRVPHPSTLRGGRAGKSDRSLFPASPAKPMWQLEGSLRILSFYGKIVRLPRQVEVRLADGKTTPHVGNRSRRRTEVRWCTPYCLISRRRGVHGDIDRERRNAVGYNHHRALARLYVGRYVEQSTNEVASRSHAHSAVVVRAGIELVLAPDVGEKHQREVGGRLGIISVSSALRQAVELRASDGVIYLPDVNIGRVTTLTNGGPPRIRIGPSPFFGV